MKKYILIILGAIFLGSCNLLWDVDTTANVSMISCKPEVNLIGGQYISLPVGGSYTEQGVEAYACDTPLTYTIVSGAVDPNTVGFYLVKYKAENSFGWATYAYRAVLVYSGNPYTTDIAGNYKIGFLFNSTVSKFDVQGFWYMDNIWAEEGVSFPVVFVEDPNNPKHFIIVPGQHPSKGYYSGTGVFNGTYLSFTLKIKDYEGNEIYKTFKWKKI